MVFLVGIVLFLVGCIIGLAFPDLDQKYVWSPIIVHRSILTHSPLLPLVFLLLFRRFLNQPLRLLIIGLCIASAVHLGFDLYPRQMIGFAQIYAPIYGRTGAVFSEVWFVMGLVVCLGLAARLIRSMDDFVLSFGGLTVVYGDCAVQEPRAALLVLLWLLPVSFLAFVFSRPKDEPDDPAVRFRKMINRL